jgi:hypothetical protein
MTEEKQKCPKCSAEARYDCPPFTEFKCDSIYYKDECRLAQSDSCRIAALESENAELKRRNSTYNDHLTKLWQGKVALEEELENIVSTYSAHEVQVEDCDRSGREDDCLEKAIIRASRLLAKPAKEGGESL